MNITCASELAPATVRTSYSADLSVTGGAEPYHWSSPDDSLPPGLTLADGGRISGEATTPGRTLITVRVTDSQQDTQEAQFWITVDATRGWQVLSILRHTTNWLAMLALVVPVIGYLPILAYELAMPGAAWAHLAAGTLTSLATFLVGCFIGFLFAVPRVVSSGALKTAGVTLGSNLAQVSDWLTKLLLGAGLVGLTRLGGPISKLLDHIAVVLQNPTAHGTAAPGANVMAGLIVIGYLVLGLLEGYVVTSVWYPRKLISLADAITTAQAGH
jgi:Putative Ig domain